MTIIVNLDSKGKNLTNPLRACYFGTYRAEYSRNQIMIEGLRRAGISVTICHETLWHSVEERVNLTKGGWKSPKFWARLVTTYWKLLRKYRLLEDYDVMIVGYPGQFDVFLARFLTRLRKKPLVWDVFMSIYLVALERKLDRDSSFTVKLLKRIEKAALQQPDRLIQDTAPYVEWLSATHHISPDRFRLVPTGADDRIFSPVDPIHTNPQIFQVLYYGTYIPNHGVGTMIEAAHLLEKDTSIQFEFIGSGPDLPTAIKRSNELKLGNIHFVDWLEKSELAQRIAAADLCLGAFGDTPQSLMTVQNKIYECLAMRKAVITGTSPATRAAFQNGVHLALCERNPQALAAAIQELRHNPGHCQSMAEAGWRLFHQHYDLENIGQTFRLAIEDLIIPKPY